VPISFWNSVKDLSLESLSLDFNTLLDQRSVSLQQYDRSLLGHTDPICIPDLDTPTREGLALNTDYFLLEKTCWDELRAVLNFPTEGPIITRS